MKKGMNSRARPKAKRARQVADDEILPEYDFHNAGPNRYAREYVAGANVVTLDPDVAAVFPNAESVNRALRALAGIIRDAVRIDGTG